MPCSDPRDARWEANDLQQRLDKVTRILCELEKHVPNGIKISKEASDWVREHRDADTRRRFIEEAAEITEALSTSRA